MGNQRTASNLNIWSFNHRVHAGYLSDSASEYASEAEACVPHFSDVRLAQEMDLSARKETVEYRPNPWSIAKINAASRGSILKPTAVGARPLGKALLSPKPQPKQIVEAFKKQAERGARRARQPIASETSERKKASLVLAQSECGRPADQPSQGIVVAHNAVPGPRAVPSKTIRPLETLPKQNSTHISTFPGHRAQSKPAASSFKLERTHGISHTSQRSFIHSSPLRPRSLIGRQRTMLAQRQSPADATCSVVHHSSPGPRPIPRTVQCMRPPVVPTPGDSDTVAAKIGIGSLGAKGMSDPATLPSWLSAAPDEGIKSPLPAPNLDDDPKPSDYVSERTHIATPEPKRKRPSSPPPILQSKKTRSAMTRSGPSAYDFGEDPDPDATWSTLPSRRTGKKAVLAKRAEKPRGMQQSRCFRLPIPGLTQKMAKQNQPTTLVQDPEAKPRVITYLPPPMAIKKPTEDAPTKNNEANQNKIAVNPEHDTDEGDVEIRVMDSDEVTLVNDDEGETMVQYNVDEVCAMYSETRAHMKEVRELCDRKGDGGAMLF